MDFYYESMNDRYEGQDIWFFTGVTNSSGRLVKSLVFKVYEDSGENLTVEDVANGYDTAMDFEVYIYDQANDTLEEYDGGMVLYSSPDYYNLTVDQIIRDVYDEFGEANVEPEIIRPKNY